MVNLPISNDTLLVPDTEQPGKKISVYKLLSQISIHEIHNYLICLISIYQLKYEIDETTGNPLISYTDMCVLIPKNVRKIMYIKLPHTCNHRDIARKVAMKLPDHLH